MHEFHHNACTESWELTCTGEVIDICAVRIVPPACMIREDHTAFCFLSCHRQAGSLVVPCFLSCHRQAGSWVVPWRKLPISTGWSTDVLEKNAKPSVNKCLPFQAFLFAAVLCGPMHDEQKLSPALCQSMHAIMIICDTWSTFTLLLGHPLEESISN